MFTYLNRVPFAPKLVIIGHFCDLLGHYYQKIIRLFEFFVSFWDFGSVSVFVFEF